MWGKFVLNFLFIAEATLAQELKVVGSAVQLSQVGSCLVCEQPSIPFPRSHCMEKFDLNKSLIWLEFHEVLLVAPLLCFIDQNCVIFYHLKDFFQYLACLASD